MDNIIIPVTNENMVAFAEEMKKRSDLLVIIGVIKSLKDKIKKSKKNNIVVKVFEDGSKKEEIINSLKDQIEEGRVVVCRKEITNNELDKFLKSSADVTVCKQKGNKFKDFCFSLWQKVMKFLFGFEFFNGDVSVVSFSENLFPVIKNIDNFSYSSRIDKWKDCDKGYVEVSSLPCKKEYDKVKTNLKFYGFWTLFLAVVASAVVYFVFVKATFLTGFIYAVAILTSLIFALIESAIFYMTLRVGQRLFKNANLSE